jgi:hypothetical protein
MLTVRDMRDDLAWIARDVAEAIDEQATDSIAQARELQRRLCRLIADIDRGKLGGEEGGNE